MGGYMVKAGGFRRRNYFIKKGLQSRFIFGFSATVVLGFLASWAFVYYTVDKRLSEALYRSHIKIETTGEIISDILLKINLIAVPLLILSAIAVGVFIVRNVTGPLRDFKEALEDFGRAELIPKTFKDIPDELSMLYNTMINNFSKVFKSARGKADELERRVQELERISSGKTISKQEVENINKIQPPIDSFGGKIQRPNKAQMTKSKCQKQIQMSKSKFQTNFKAQNPNDKKNFWILDFIWHLSFGFFTLLVPQTFLRKDLRLLSLIISCYLLSAGTV